MRVRSRKLKTLVAAMLLAAAISIAPMFVSIANADPSPEEAKTISELINSIKTSPLTFLRNGKEYSGVQAGGHFEVKYDHFKKEIKTAEDFIDRCASESIFTGKPYLVRLSSGEEKPVKDWLTEKLKTTREGK